MQILGLEQLANSLTQFVKAQEKRVADLRREVVQTLVTELTNNIPVWSGRTMESIRVNNTGAYASLQGEPSPPFGEQNRSAAVGQALAEVARADYQISKAVYVTIHSEAWGLVEMARAPNPQEARNKAVVSEIAMARTRAKYKFLR
jgi:hypothetical protein